ncbi:FKBP12-associated protein [Mortierella sp. GBA43]|nr:FKBP12-associated protein [Mortierella sp. GBA43]
MSGCKCGHLAKEVPCNASAENPWDRKSRTIKCNDYCLIAERNKRVATAFGIDPDATRSPRIPQYDNHVLEYALDNMEFTLKMEKRLADWVADTSVQVLNLPPMKGHHRKFVHELVAHYNVASESVDVEPYRSVVIHRKLNTSVPDLLASQACRQKRVAISPSLAAAGGVEQLRKSVVKEPVNAIYLHDLADGLMRGQLITQLAPVFGNIKYGIRWLTDDDAVLVPHPGNMTMDELEVVLIRLRTGIKALTSQGQICERAELCWVNRDGDVTGHTNAGSKRYFNAAQGSQLMKKAGPAKVENTFALLDDEERVTAARRAEEERILRAKEAAGTLSLEAWEEDAANTSFPSSYAWTSRPSSVEYADHSDHSSSSRSPSSPRKVKKEESNDDVVDDWQELLDDN